MLTNSNSDEELGNLPEKTTTEEEFERCLWPSIRIWLGRKLHDFKKVYRAPLQVFDLAPPKVIAERRGADPLSHKVPEL